MSKKLWLPPTKIFQGDQVVRPLPKVRIKGIELNSPAGQYILDAFAGRIGQFHLASAHNYSLAPQPVFRSQRADDDIRMRYTNLQGQEIIDIEVNPVILKRLEQPNPTPWDWAIINFQVPGAEIANFAAFMQVPLLRETVDASRTRGVSVDYATVAYGAIPMSFPDVGNSEFSTLGAAAIAGDFFQSSLLVDLSVVGPKSGVVIDIYGNVVESEAPACDLQLKRFPVTYTLTMPTDPPTTWPADWDPLIDDYPWFVRGDFEFRWADCTQSSFLIYLGSFANNFGTDSWPAQLTYERTVSHGSLGSATFTFTAVRAGTTLTITVTCDNPDMTIFGEWDSPWDGNSDNSWWLLAISGSGASWDTQTFATTTPSISYSNPTESGSAAETHDGGWSTSTGAMTRYNYNYYFAPYLFAGAPLGDPPTEENTYTYDVKGVTGHGPPHWEYSQRTATGGQQFEQWERLGVYPNELALLTVREGLQIEGSTGATADMATFYGLNYLGQLIIDRQFGGITFNTTV